MQNFVTVTVLLLSVYIYVNVLYKCNHDNSLLYYMKMCFTKCHWKKLLEIFVIKTKVTYLISSWNPSSISLSASSNTNVLIVEGSKISSCISCLIRPEFILRKQ